MQDSEEGRRVSRLAIRNSTDSDTRCLEPRAKAGRAKRLAWVALVLILLFLMATGTVVAYTLARNPCKHAQYFDDNLDKCMDCQQLCTNCISLNECSGCVEGYELLNTTQKKGQVYGVCQSPDFA